MDSSVFTDSQVTLQIIPWMQQASYISDYFVLWLCQPV